MLNFTKFLISVLLNIGYIVFGAGVSAVASAGIANLVGVFLMFVGTVFIIFAVIAKLVVTLYVE